MIASSIVSVKTEAVLGMTQIHGVANPFEGKSPDFEFFGVTFKNTAVGVVTGIWGLVILLIAAALLWNTGKWGIARQRGMSDDMEDGMTGLKRSAVALGVAALFGVIVGALLQLSGNLT